MSSEPIVYTDDPDASWSFTITDADGGTLDWSPVEVAVGEAAYLLTATWLGSAPAATPGVATTRRVKVPLDSLAASYHTLYLKVPGANDVELGRVEVRVRS